MLGTTGPVSLGLHAHQSESHSPGTRPAPGAPLSRSFESVAPLYWSSLSLSKNI